MVHQLSSPDERARLYETALLASPWAQASATPDQSLERNQCLGHDGMAFDMSC